MLHNFIVGEAWQDIMMDCAARPGEVKCDTRADDVTSYHDCGSSIAYPYFISFYVLCSFLVRSISLNLHPWINNNNHPCTDHQLVRGRHHGQLWLLDPRLVHLGSAPSGRVYSSVERIRPRRQGANQASRRRHASEENLTATWFWQTLPAQSGLQGWNANYSREIKVRQPAGERSCAGCITLISFVI